VSREADDLTSREKRGREILRPRLSIYSELPRKVGEGLIDFSYAKSFFRKVRLEQLFFVPIQENTH